MERRYVRFIYNPFSGENKILNNLDYIIESYQAHGYTIVPFRLTQECTVEKAFDNIDIGYHHILAAGGDGTVNLVVNEMKKRGIDIPLAVLPAGTANDFAKLLGHSANIKKACEEILEGEEKRIDIGLANDTYFVNVLSAGLFTDISQKTPTALKNTFGKLAYYVTSYISSIQELPNFKKIHIKIDSNDLLYDDHALLIFVFNGRTAGNMNFAYCSDVQDGLFDILIIKGDNIADTFKTAFHFFMGKENEYPRGVVHFKSKELVFSSDDGLTVAIDGEGGPTVPIHISCIKDGLRVIMPKEQAEDEEEEKPEERSHRRRHRKTEKEKQ